MRPGRSIVGWIACAFLPALLIAATPLTAQTAAPFTFLAIGDAGEAGRQLDQNAQRMRERAVADSAQGAPLGMLLFLGDNFYPNGLNLKAPERAREIAGVIGPHRELMGKLGPENVQGITGNHDYYCTAVNNIPYGSCTEGVQFEFEVPGWTFHAKYPASVRRALAAGGSDSVELIFFDSSLLLITKPETWPVVLDSLERLLRASAAAPGVGWRIFVAHHSPCSVGDHAGYRRWDRKKKQIVYIGNCIEEGKDPFRYVQQFVSEQDNCTPRYKAYTDSLTARIERGGAKIQLFLAGHDHSLQFLNYPDRGGPNAPKVFAISGAGSKVGTVKSPTPPLEYTHPRNDDRNKGKSAFGFVEGRFEGDRLALTYIDGESGSTMDMGGGAGTFVIDRSGAVVQTR